MAADEKIEEKRSMISSLIIAKSSYCLVSVVSHVCFIDISIKPIFLWYDFYFRLIRLSQGVVNSMAGLRLGESPMASASVLKALA